jgi:hypothetical protein
MSFNSLIERAQPIAYRIIRFLYSCLLGLTTIVITTGLGAAIIVARIAKLLYRLRSKIIDILVRIVAIVLAVHTLNQILGPKDYISRVELHSWFRRDYHWAIVLGITSVVLLMTWNYISATLRTFFGKNWIRIWVWSLVGVSLLVTAYIGFPRENIAYRSGYVGAIILYVVALAVIAKVWCPKGFVLSESPYIDDDPIGYEGSAPYETQKRIVADIKHLIEGGMPSVFAITGDWGIGKTFLYLTARKDLEKNKSIIWMNFEPWRYASEEALIRGFYQDIGTTLADKIPGIQHIIKPLAETTDKFVRQHDATGIFGTTMDALRTILKSNKSPEMQIKELLADERRRLVIVIDDVERSFSPEQIFRTLQLSHFAKGIDNVQVVFLYEKDIILKACPEHHAGSLQTAAEYLEKFVQVEVFVPSPRPSELRQLFFSFMGIHIDRLGFNFTEDDLSDEMLQAINTPRRVKLLATEFVTFRMNLEQE